MEMKFTSIDFSHRPAEGCRSSWLQTLDSQLIDCSPIGSANAILCLEYYVVAAFPQNFFNSEIIFNFPFWCIVMRGAARRVMSTESEPRSELPEPLVEEL